MLALLLLLSPVAFSQAWLDCDALANSAGAEPPGYAWQCGTQQLPMAPAPWLTTPAGVDDVAFAQNVTDIYGQHGLHAFLLGDLSSATLLGDPGMPSFFAMDFDPTGTTLYAIRETSPRQLGTLDTSDGSFTVIADLGSPQSEQVTGLAIHPVTGAAYLSTSHGADGTLYSLDLVTGATSPIGNFGVSHMIDIAMNCEGELYGHGIDEDALYGIDPATGAATLIGLHGLPANFAQGMDFNNADGKLYAAVYTGGGQYHYGTFNLQTGALNELGNNDLPGEWEIAIPAPCTGVFADGFESR